MAEYIEREKLINIIKERNGRVPDWIMECISDCPKAADVRPERHGRWTDTGINLHDRSGERGYQCNSCNDIYFVEPDEIVYYKFCPHCGAKMDEKGGD